MADHVHYTVQLVVTASARDPGPAWDRVAHAIAVDLPGRGFMLDGRRVRIIKAEVDSSEEGADDGSA